MKRHTQLILRLKDKRGVTAIMVALMAFVLFGFGALTVDIGHLCLVRNQLKNAADAGALAGARVLLNEDGSINQMANVTAQAAATQNVSEGATFVEVTYDVNNDNEGDVQRGHWSFVTGQFTPNGNLQQVDIWGHSFAELDGMEDLINAVRVRTRRENIPAAHFFARILGEYAGFIMSNESVAWLGFAGSFEPGELDQPIAICREAIVKDNIYECNVGRMITSGLPNHQTGGWTDFNQEGNPCQGGTNAPDVRDLVCGDGNPDTLKWGNDMATSGGEIQSAFADFIDCWIQETGGTYPPAQPWNMTLPVIGCPGNNVGTCEKLRGAVNLNVMWIIDQGHTSGENAYAETPTQMQGVGEVPYWPIDGVPCYNIESSTAIERQACWNSFAAHFNLRDVDGTLLDSDDYRHKTIYFLPDCEPHEPHGGSGGGAYGVFAEIPKLVQ